MVVVVVMVVVIVVVVIIVLSRSCFERSFHKYRGYNRITLQKMVAGM